MRRVVRFVLDERGGTLVEYAIIVALVAAVAVAAVALFGKNVAGLLHSGAAAQ
ncbi:MAG: Flp family type IVb pilin [Vulcanimicrobiaceae bacterium]